MVCKTSSRNAGYLPLVTTKHGRLLGSGFENEAIWNQFSRNAARLSAGENEAWCAKPVLGMPGCFVVRTKHDCWAVGWRTKPFGLV